MTIDVNGILSHKASLKNSGFYTSFCKLYAHYGRFKKFMLGKLVDFSVKWVDEVPLVH